MTDKDLSTEAEVDTEEKKAAPPPHQLKDRARVCGKWQKKGYKPSKEELAAWNKRCKEGNRDPKSGRRIAKKK